MYIFCILPFKEPIFSLQLIIEGMALSTTRMFPFLSTCRSSHVYLQIEIFLSNTYHVLYFDIY